MSSPKETCLQTCLLIFFGIFKAIHFQATCLETCLLGRRHVSMVFLKLEKSQFLIDMSTDMSLYWGEALDLPPQKETCLLLGE